MTEEYGQIEGRNIDKVVFGNLEFDTWYGNTAYFMQNEPQELGYVFANRQIRTKNSAKWSPEYRDKVWLQRLYVCNYCFKYADEESIVETHRSTCRYRFKLPGRLMYKDDRNKRWIRKVRGKNHKLFCANMCLFGKLFLDNKSVFFNLETYDFYVVYGADSAGEVVPMGFFSKELLSWDDNNLACILVFPPFQNQRLGQMLISFSYELSRFESKISGPEHPLSPFGKQSYLSYWSKYIAREFVKGELSVYEDCSITLKELSKLTGFRIDDVVMALDYMKCLLEFGDKNVYHDYETSGYDEGSNYDVVILKKRIVEYAKGKDLSRSVRAENLILF